jgi:hypothetical protein
MIEVTEGLERRSLARGLKILLDLLFFLTLTLAVMSVVSLGISAFTDYDEGWDLIVPANLGEGSFFSPSFTVEYEMHPPPEFEAVRLGDGQGKLHLFHNNLPLHLVNAAAYLVAFGVILWALALLRRILAATSRGRPFDPFNPRRLNALGWIILCTALLSSLFQYLASRWALSIVEVVSPPLSPLVRVNAGWVVCGLLALVLAAIWKEAVRMAEEQALTV